VGRKNFEITILRIIIELRASFSFCPKIQDAYKGKPGERLRTW
jgi:hypothetical protein